MPIILDTWEAQIRRIVVPGQLGQKIVCKTLSPWEKKLGMVALSCHPRYSGNSIIGGSQGKKVDFIISKITREKKSWMCVSSGTAPA
jgi:hypothetical protein